MLGEPGPKGRLGNSEIKGVRTQLNPTIIKNPSCSGCGQWNASSAAKKTFVKYERIWGILVRHWKPKTAPDPPQDRPRASRDRIRPAKTATRPPQDHPRQRRKCPETAPNPQVSLKNLKEAAVHTRCAWTKLEVSRRLQPATYTVFHVDSDSAIRYC